jgi:hypothetical protein
MTVIGVGVSRELVSGGPIRYKITIAGVVARKKGRTYSHGIDPKYYGAYGNDEKLGNCANTVCLAGVFHP